MGTIVNSVTSITKGTGIDASHLNFNLNLNLNLNIATISQPPKVKEEDG